MFGYVFVIHIRKSFGERELLCVLMYNIAIYYD